MDKLLPCPFCGGKAGLTDKESYGYYDYVFAECLNSKCLVHPTTRHFDNIRWSQADGNVSQRDWARMKATEAWNTRKE